MKKKNILIFGGSGFLGSHVADQLTEAGHKVTIIDQKSSPWINVKQKFFKADITKSISYETILKKNEIVFNFAAISDIETANYLPVKTVETNVLSFVKLLELCKKHKIKKFIQASTIYVSGDHGGFYKASKLSAETYLREFNRILGVKYCILRYGTLYGPRSDLTNGLHAIIKKTLEKKKIIYSGSPESMRDYIHVLDAARISIKALENEFENKTIIISGPESYKINDILKIISEITGIKKITFVKKNKSKLHSHYLRTPYSIENTSNFSLKYSDNFNLDIGQGLSSLIQEIKKKYKIKQ